MADLLRAEWPEAWRRWQDLGAEVIDQPGAGSALGILGVRSRRSTYERALRGDSLDAGIHLNRATALMVIGDRSRSSESFALGVKLAGGLANAQTLLGLPPEGQTGERAGKKTMIDPEQVRAMLKHAATTVPSDSVRKSGNPANAATGTQPSAWRSAGPRAADGSESQFLLYWKR